jgi:hypothetical protein
MCSISFFSNVTLTSQAHGKYVWWLDGSFGTMNVNPTFIPSEGDDLFREDAFITNIAYGIPFLAEQGWMRTTLCFVRVIFLGTLQINWVILWEPNVTINGHKSTALLSGAVKHSTGLGRQFVECYFLRGRIVGRTHCCIEIVDYGWC